MSNLSPTTLLIQDLISAPNKAESILESLTADQIKMDKSQLPSPVASPSSTPAEDLSEDTSSATAIANALAAAMVSAALQASNTTLATKTNTNGTVAPSKTVTNNMTANTSMALKWVSFVYSHNRTLKRYSIRTDIQTVALGIVDDQFKADNCVRDIQSNRWAYETECNDLGWKLAWLNKSEIAGKRGLIQRAVDSYRNRYPSMRSRRVARQEKLLNGTLRKRKIREDESETSSDSNTISSPTAVVTSTPPQPFPTSLEAAIVKPAHQPKTVAIDDPTNNTRYRIKIGIESISLEEIKEDFRKQNCAFPRAVQSTPEQYTGGRTRWLEDSMINELGWKLAYLNPRRALDVFRTKFMPMFHPRKHSSRTSISKVLPEPSGTIDQTQLLKMMPPSMSTPLTASALNAQNALFDKKKKYTKKSKMTCLSFGNCFSLDDEASNKTKLALGSKLSDAVTQPDQDPMISPSYDNIYSDARFSPFDESTSCHTSSSANSIACTPSPPATAGIFGFADTDLYDSFMLPPVNDSFMLLDSNDLKAYDPLMSPSLPSSAVGEDLVKLEEDFHDDFDTAHLLDPLF
ncbi:hypothetical protein BD560DRAFT_383079 [Blakeslea trispora]|nr:hypothetical protein BD560DRAFT_383079 [Blakeslea trispora]